MSGSERIVEDGGRTPRAELVRGLGLMAAVSVNVANMIGTGVFLKTRVMTCNVEAPLLVMLVWAAAGLLSLLGALCYAELSAAMPAAGRRSSRRGAAATRPRPPPSSWISTLRRFKLA